MNLDDETLLSAYLDDELDPADRLAVEWSVESSPPLADQLRSLATARDAVTGLGRPVLPFDLAPTITARLAADRRRARLQAMARPGRVALAVAGLSGMAASLLYALLLLHRSMHEGPDTTEFVQKAPNDPQIRTHSPRDLASNPNPATKVSVAPERVIPAPHQDSRPSPIASRSPADLREREDRLKITRMLENPEVRVILVVTDVIDASNQIQGLIQLDARATPDFGRITLQTGIVVDPARPGSAEVFVVPINEGGRRSFVARLRDKFRDLEEEDEKSVPELVTQLTEVGQVAIHEGTHASPLVEPPVDIRPLATRAGSPAEADEFLPGHRTEGVSPPTSPGHLVGKPEVDVGLPVGPPPRLKLTDPVTLVVWVTRSGSH